MEHRTSQAEHLYTFFHVLFRKKGMAAAICMAAFGGILFGTYLVTPMWKATAKVRVQYNPKQQLNLAQGITTPGTPVPGVNPANDAIQMLGSRELAEEVVLAFERDKLWERRETAPEETRAIIRWHIHDVLIGTPVGFLQDLGILSETPDNYLAMAVEEFQEDLEDIELEEESTVVNVSVWGESPALATAMANVLVEHLLEKNLEASQIPINKTIAATKTELAQAEAALDEAQQNLQKFKERSGLVLYDQEATLLLQRLDNFESELSALRGQMASLRVDKSERHPEVQILSARIAEYSDLLIPQVKAELAALPLKEVELARLSQELRVREDLHSALKQKLLDLEVLRNSSLGDLELTVLDKAQVYSDIKPDWPKWVITIPLALTASIVAALFFVFLQEYWNTSYKSVKDLDRDFPVPALGAVPKFGVLKKRRVLASLRARPETAASEGLPVPYDGRFLSATADGEDTVAEAMLLSSRGKGGTVFLIASPGFGEGKSMTATVLAKGVAARGKRVLLIETNFRSPVFARLMDTGTCVGLADYLSGDADQPDILTTGAGVDVIVAGKSPVQNPFVLLGSERLGQLLERARRTYDVVLMDSPCVKRFTDPLLTAAHADGVIVVAEANRTQQREILMVLNRFRTADVPVTGIVLNKHRNYVPGIIRSLLS